MIILTIINTLALVFIAIRYARGKSKKIRAKNITQEVRYGKYSNVSGNSFDGICSNRNTTIGKFTSIALNVKVGLSEHPTSFLSTHGFQYLENAFGFINKDNLYDISHLNKPCKIGNDIWIGDGANIKAGVEVGDGAVVGAGAMVTKDVPPYAIVGGVPAKIIRYRFDERTIADLLEIKWWDLPEDFIQKLPCDNINECIKICKNFKAKK